MAVESVHEQLSRASAEIEAACEASTAADSEAYLTGIVRLLDYYVAGDFDDPEAHAYPQPGALDTIQYRLAEVVEELDDPAAEHLQNARSQLLELIVALDGRLTEGRPTSR